MTKFANKYLRYDVEEGIEEYNNGIGGFGTVTRRLKRLLDIPSAPKMSLLFSKGEISKSNLLRSLYYDLEADHYTKFFDKRVLVEKALKDLNDIFSHQRRFLVLKDLGLSNKESSLFAHYCDIDPMAFKIAVEITNRICGIKEDGHNFDSASVWGMSPSLIGKAWFANGAKDGAKFRLFLSEMAYVLKQRGRIDFFGNIIPKKGDSIEFYRDYLKGVRFLENSTDNGRYRYSRKATRVLGKLSRVARVAAIRNIDTMEMMNSERVRIRDLNWDAVKYWLSKSKREQTKLFSVKEAWYALYKRVPNGIDNDSSVHPSNLDKVMLKSFRMLMSDKPENEDFGSFSEPAIRLSYFFRDSQSVKRFIVKGGFTSVHDAGQFILPQRVDLDFWKRMALRDPNFLKFSGAFYTIERLVKKGDIKKLPESLTDLKEAASLCSYEDVGNMEVSFIAASYNLSENDAKKYDDFFKNNPRKSFESIPHVFIEGGDYTFEKMDGFDIEGPFLGLATSCCQHLSSVGAPCAKAGYRSGFSGFYVVRKNNEIVAQSWAWRSEDGSLVFDSIEAKSSTSESAIAEIYMAAAKELIGKLGVTQVLVGNTGYGLTLNVKKYFGIKGSKSAPIMFEDC